MSEARRVSDCDVQSSGSVAPPALGDSPTSDLAPVVGANLRRLRVRRGLSLERLARASGVSRAMLGQIELGQSAPTINVLWKVARALDVSFSALIGGGENRASAVVLPRAQAKVLTSYDGTFCSRALFPFSGERRKVEFYELRLTGRRSEKAEPHAAGTTENLIVAAGKLELVTAGERFVLNKGDAIFFNADVPHEYHNPDDAEAVMYLVMTYA